MQSLPGTNGARYTVQALAVLALTLLGASAAAQLNCNVGVQFYPGGGIESCNLNGDHRLYTARGQPLTCLNGRRLVQYPDGRLKSCTLAQPVNFEARPCARLSVVQLDPDGKLKKCAQP
ncbi:MAG: hypothetical protein BMS9Abin10_0195 [Gammaproteobacteria bacterium]|nr:MAG: hypothetical protein BMS9Abin10_0195 [Gammaproteobacteria bacterium]